MGGKSSEQSSQSTQQSQSGSGQAWANPFATAGVGEVFNTYLANKPNLDAQVAKANALSDQLAGAHSGASANYGNAVSAYNNIASSPNAGAGYYNDVLSGQYLNGNPYLQAIIDASKGDIMDSVGSQFELGGRYGPNAAYGKGLGTALANMESTLRYGDYNNQMNRMDTAAAGSVGEQLARQQLAQQNQQAASSREAQLAALSLGQQQAAAQLPYTGANTLAQALSALFNGGTSSGQSSSYGYEKDNSFLGGLGQALGTAAMFF